MKSLITHSKSNYVFKKIDKDDTLMKPKPTLPKATPAFPQQLDQDQLASHVFIPVSKLIRSEVDLKQFLNSESASEFMSFVLWLNDAVAGMTQEECAAESSAPVQKLASSLRSMKEWINEIPIAARDTVRFGNTAFRVWCQKMVEQAESILEGMVPAHLQAYREGICSELKGYFVESFGNSQRIDYGTGHETNFVVLLFCMSKIGIFQPSDGKGLVGTAFGEYLSLVRSLQMAYTLEPAGTHGVWGLDDFQVLPFLWGSSQLVKHPTILPSSIHTPSIVESEHGHYLYLGCIKFIKDLKKGPFFETSPMLNDISGIPTWAEINAGMVKLYKGELLHKFPIMQHFLFGSLIRCKD